VRSTPGGTLPPLDINKFVQPLIKPPAMPGDFKKNKDKYKIGVRQFAQQILPSPHPMTTVWSYGSVDFPGTVLEGGSILEGLPDGASGVPVVPGGQPGGGGAAGGGAAGGGEPK